MFLDSLDQLAAGSGATVSWLPSDLPANVALITTTRPGEYLASLRGRLPEDLVCELRPMPPEEGRQLLEDWLAAAKRTLRPSQAAEILGRFATGGSPLYLRLAFEEAKLWPADMTDVFLGSDVPSIIGDLYDRLAAEHGPQLVGHALGFLGCTYERLGLSEDEMLDTLSADDEVWQEFTAGARWEMAVRQLPVVVWSRLYFDLAPYLSPRASEGASLMSFFHKELSDVATARYLGGRAKHMHDVLADVMLSLARGKEAAEREWRGSNHALAELPFHLIGAERWDDVFATLTDFTYLEDKARRVAVVEAKDVEGSEATVYDGVLALVDDYDRALAAFPTESGHEMGGLTTERTDQRFVLEAFGKALAREAHNLRERSDLLWQQMFNRLQWVEGPGVEAVVSGILAPELKERGRPGAGPWLHSLTRPRESGALVSTLTGHTDYVKAAAFSPDGAHIASGSRDVTVKVWAADSGAELATLDHGGEVTAVAYSPDGSRLAAGSTEGTVKIWDAATGAETATFDQTDRVLALAFSPDGSHVVSDSYDSYIDTLKVWDAATGAELVHLRGQRGSVTPFGIPLRRADMAFSRDLTRIVSGIYRDTLTVWDTVRGAELATLTGHADPVWAVAFFPDGTRIVSGSMDNSLKVLDAATCAELATLTGHTGDVQACAVSPDGAWVVSGSDDKTVKVWDVAAAVELGTPSGHTSQVNAVAFSSDGTRVASGSGTVFDSSDNSVKVWDAAIGAELATLRGHKLSVHTVAYSPDGTRIVSGARDWILKVWDVASGKELTTLRGHTNDVNAAAYSPDGTRIVSGSKSSVVPAVTLYGPSSDDTLKVWDAASGAELANLADHTHEVYAVDYSPDGSRIVSGSSDKTLKIWDAGTGEELATLSGHMGRVQAAAYSPDGTRIVSGSADHTLKVWDAATGAELATLFGHTQSVNAVGFSADGSQIASSSDDSTLKVWDAHTTECLATLPCLGPVGGCDYSPHGTRICCGDTSGTVYILELMGSSV